MNFAGVRGLPNADWCEDHKVETARSNILGVMNLVDCCFLLDIHITQFASACLFEHDAAHPAENRHFTEDDQPFYKDSFYSYTRFVSEEVRSSPKASLGPLCHHCLTLECSRACRLSDTTQICSYFAYVRRFLRISTQTIFSLSYSTIKRFSIYHR